MTQPFTADLCAVAIVAAARHLGLDPLAACRPTRGTFRRPMAPAAVALARTMGRPERHAARVLGLSDTTIPHARKNSPDELDLAAAAAVAALESWRMRLSPPEAAAAPPAAPPIEGVGEVQFWPGAPTIHPRFTALPSAASARKRTAKPAKPAPAQSHAQRMEMIRAAAEKAGILRAAPPRPPLQPELVDLSEDGDLDLRAVLG